CRPMTARPGLARQPVTVCEGGRPREAEDWLVEEAAVELRYNDATFAVMMATPLDLEDFAYGFSLSEERVASASDIHAVRMQAQDAGHVIDIAVSATVPVNLSPELARLLPGRSGCGLCGNRRLEDVMRPAPPVPDGLELAPGALARARAARSMRRPGPRRRARSCMCERTSAATMRSTSCSARSSASGSTCGAASCSSPAAPATRW